MLPPVLWHIADTQLNGSGRRRYGDRFPARQYLAGIGRRQTEYGLSDLGAARADQARQSHDFAAPNGKRNVVQAGRATGNIPQLQRNFPYRHFTLWEHRGYGTAHHQFDQLLTAYFARVARGYGLAVSKNSNAIRNRRNLFQAVRNKDDAQALSAQRSKDSEEVFDFSIRQCRGGFVGDQNLGVGPDCLGDFHYLLLRHAKTAGQAVGVDRSTGAL